MRGKVGMGPPGIEPGSRGSKPRALSIELRTQPGDSSTICYPCSDDLPAERPLARGLASARRLRSDFLGALRLRRPQLYPAQSPRRRALARLARLSLRHVFSRRVRARQLPAPPRPVDFRRRRDVSLPPVELRAPRGQRRAGLPLLPPAA